MKLTFTDSALGRQRYEMAFQAVAMTKRDIAVSEWDTVTDLVRKLKLIGVVAEEKLAGIELWELKKGGGSVDLEKAESRMLIDFIKQPVWRPLAIPDAKALVDWLQKGDTPVRR